MRTRPIVLTILALLLSMYLESPAPIMIWGGLCLLFFACRDSAYAVPHQSYPDRHLTDALSKDGSVTNLRGVPLEDILTGKAGGTFRRDQAEVNNDLALNNNDGKGPYDPQ